MNHDSDKRLRDVETEVTRLTSRAEFSEKGFAELQEKLSEVHVTVLTWKPCPQAALCAEVSQALIRLKEDVDELKLSKAVIVRGWKAIGIISASATAIATFIYTLWRAIEYFIHRKP